MSDDNDPSERLYGVLFEVVKADAAQHPHEPADSTLNAVAWLLLDLAGQLGVPPHLVITNLAEMAGGTIERVALRQDEEKEPPS